MSPRCEVGIQLDSSKLGRLSANKMMIDGSQNLGILTFPEI